MVMKIFVKKIEGLTLPTKGSTVAAGYDIVATNDPKIVGVSDNEENGNKFWRDVAYIEYETNLFISPQLNSVHILIHPRSSISKYNLILANSIGLIDNDYRGMIICRFKYIWQPTDLYQYRNALVGTVREDKIYKKGDKIAQLVIKPTIEAEWEVVDDLDKTQRGEGGFGSTDHPKQEYSKNTVFSKKSLADMYNESGGVPTKSSYLEEIKKSQKE